jgi:hypothetical protein
MTGHIGPRHKRWPRRHFSRAKKKKRSKLTPTLRKGARSIFLPTIPPLTRSHERLAGYTVSGTARCDALHNVQYFLEWEMREATGTVEAELVQARSGLRERVGDCACLHVMAYLSVSWCAACTLRKSEPHEEQVFCLRCCAVSVSL